MKTHYKRMQGSRATRRWGGSVNIGEASLNLCADEKKKGGKRKPESDWLRPASCLGLICDSWKRHFKGRKNDYDHNESKRSAHTFHLTAHFALICQLCPLFFPPLHYSFHHAPNTCKATCVIFGGELIRNVQTILNSMCGRY